MKAIKLDGWSGIHYIRVDVVGETAKRARVKVTEDSAMLPGYRHNRRGDVILVPKYALVEISEAVYEKSKR